MAGRPSRRRAGGIGSARSSAARALELAYRYLNRRERTVHELRAYLTRRELDAGAVDEAITELIETGAVDDARYARLFVEDKRRLEQWGSARIRDELARRGIGRELIEAALQADSDGGGHGSGPSELERALSLLEQRFPDPPRERRDWQRALGVLVRRGYTPELAIDALTAYSRDPA